MEESTKTTILYVDKNFQKLDFSAEELLHRKQIKWANLPTYTYSPYFSSYNRAWHEKISKLTHLGCIRICSTKKRDDFYHPSATKFRHVKHLLGYDKQKVIIQMVKDRLTSPGFKC